MDFYKLLNIGISATEEQIRSAYRKLAMESHPDRNPGDKEAENRFKAIKEAYESLIDNNKRARYNANNTKTTKTYHKQPAQKRKEVFSFYDAPPPAFDIWGKPLSMKQREEWSKNNKINIVELQNKVRKNNDYEFKDIFRYENEGVPDIRM